MNNNQPIKVTIIEAVKEAFKKQAEQDALWAP